tara:strand:+ start:59 stop:1198 length:1140 start_codon:yes stop_codon:yes gene_type:complete
MINKFLSIFERDWSFKKIKQSKYLILEHGHDEVFLNYFKKRDIEFVYFNKEINLYLVIKLLINLKKISQLNYYKLAIKLSNPKTIITATDNNKNFYRLKKYFKKKKFIAIQNGYRNDKELFESNGNNEKFKCDNIFCFGSQNISYYKSKVDAKIIPVGAIRNNLISKFKNRKIINCLTYISEFRLKKSFHYNKLNYKKMYGLNFENFNDFISSEIKIIKLIYLICKKKNIPFYIVGSSDSDPIKEKKWYQKILKEKKINFKPKKSYRSSYDFLIRSKYIANIDSTLGYEFLARNKKIIFFSRNINSSKKINDLWNFGWPSVFKKKGFFFTNELKIKETERLINNMISSSKKNWISKINPVKRKIMNYQPGNKKLLKVIK